MLRILLCGYYGQMNSGDDALAYVCLDQIYKYWNDNVIVEIMSDTPIAHPCQIKVVYPNLTRKFSRISALLRADALVYGGGGVFQDHRGLGDLYEKLKFAIIAKLKKIPIVYLSVSIGPLTTRRGKVLTKMILNLADFVSVRDEKSYNILKEELKICTELDLTYDLALLMRESVTVVSREEKTVGVSLLPLVDSFYLKHDKHLYENICRSLNWVALQGYKIKFIAFNKTSGDDSISKKISEQIAPPVEIEFVDYNKNPYSVLEEVGRCTVFVGMRLHAIIFSYVMNVPCLMINYHPKCEEFVKHMRINSETIIDNSFELTDKLKAIISMKPCPEGNSVDGYLQNINASINKAFGILDSKMGNNLKVHDE